MIRKEGDQEAKNHDDGAMTYVTKHYSEEERKCNWAYDWRIGFFVSGNAIRICYYLKHKRKFIRIKMSGRTNFRKRNTFQLNVDHFLFILFVILLLAPLRHWILWWWHIYKGVLTIWSNQSLKLQLVAITPHIPI